MMIDSQDAIRILATGLTASEVKDIFFKEDPFMIEYKTSLVIAVRETDKHYVDTDMLLVLMMKHIEREQVSHVTDEKYDQVLDAQGSVLDSMELY